MERKTRIKIKVSDVIVIMCVILATFVTVWGGLTMKNLLETEGDDQGPLNKTTVVNASVQVKQTLTFYPCFNLALDNQTSIVEIAARANSSIPGVPGSRVFEIIYKASYAGINFTSSPALRQFTLEAGIGSWQCESPMGTDTTWDFIACNDAIVTIGLVVYNGNSTQETVNLGIDLLVFYSTV